LENVGERPRIRNYPFCYHDSHTHPANMNPQTCDGYRFHQFEARVRTGLLLRDGQRIKIEDLPFQMLLILLEKPGHVVSKEELRDRLWGEKTFGELDNSLHVAAAKLREALRETADGAGLIETVRRRGYQFKGDVVQIFDAPVEATTGLSTPLEAMPRQRGLRPLVPWAVGISLGLAVAAIAGFVVRSHARLPLAGSGDNVVIGGFTNSTGDDSYTGLSHAFRVKLEESPYLSLVADRRFRQTVADPDAASVQEQLKGCSSLKGKILLTGQLTSSSNGYEVTTTAWDCAKGRMLDNEGSHALTKVRILSALDLATDQMRRRLGESDSSLQKFNVPLEQATTASPAALKAFTLGEERRAQGQEFESITDYKLATDLDPQFALAYARLGTIYYNAAEPNLSGAYYKKAFEMRERTTDRERLYIAAHYYSFATGEIQRSIDAFELWHSIYPRDSSPANNLAVEYLSIGQPEKAEQMARVATQLDPSSNFSDAILARVYLETEDYKDLKNLCSNSTPAKAETMTLHESCFLLAFIQNDASAMQQQLQLARGNAAEGEFLDEAAWVAMYGGKITEGRRLFAESRQSALSHKFVEMAATVDLDEATLEADLGYAPEAKTHALEALSLAPESTPTQALGALVLARTGDVRQAELAAEKAAARAPLDTILNAVELASVRAVIQLRSNNPSAAIQSLEQAHPFDLCSTMALAPGYYRGLAYLQANQLKDAAGEFRRVIDHRALAPDSPYIALADLNLGRALQRAGDTKDAAASYEQAETIWKDADSDFVPLRQLRCLRQSLTVQGSRSLSLSCGHS
jgi:DNA-binding winged helix-turn-helix (wHTH) protein/tetratricopeptide (TPR) repeat protein